MIFFILLISVLMLLFLRILKVVGKDNILLSTFYYIWIAVFLGLVIFNKKSLDYISEEGIIIIFAHIVVLFLGVLIVPPPKKENVKIRKTIKLTIPFLFYTFFILSIIGLYIFSQSVNLYESILNNQIVQLRVNVLLKDVEISPLAIFLTNFLYPLAIIAPIYTLYQKKRIFLLILVILLFFIYSLSTGGKGGVILLIATLAGSILFLLKSKIIILDRRLKLLSILVVLSILGIFSWITYYRMLYTGDSFYDAISDMFVSYFTTSIPAFCQLLNEKGYSLINFDLTQHNLVKNFASLLGVTYQRNMDSYIVYVPEPFNVYSSLADSILSIGLLGSLIYYLFIGVVFGIVNKMKQLKAIFLFSIFFLFSFYSFFVDIFYFMLGSWFCFFLFIFIDLKLDAQLEQ